MARNCSRLPVLLLAWFPFAAHAASTVTLSSSPNPSTFGQPVTITATLTPAASGAVTFYDGATVLGTKTATGGVASLTTIALPSGVRQIGAHFSGNPPGISATITQRLMAVAANGFRPAYAYNGTSLMNAAISLTLATADFNNDGKADLATNYGILLGNGDGSFQEPILYPISLIQAYGLGTGDFNGDGKTDLISASFSGQFIVLLGNGDGTFKSAGTYTDAAAGLYAVAVGDFNGDGNADLALGDSTGVAVRLGNGDGTFQAAVYYGQNPGLVLVAGDFNGDGKVDLAASAGFVLLGNGDGAFGAPIQLPASGGSMTVGDFNTDGKLDIAMTSAQVISVLLGKGDGTFQSPVQYSAPGPNSIVAGDLNGDGRIDLAATSGGGGIGSINILFGNGDGTFQSVISYPAAGGSPTSGMDLVIADFNGDGRADLADSASILLGMEFASSAVSLSSSANPALLGQPVTLTAAVTPTAATGT